MYNDKNKLNIILDNWTDYYIKAGFLGEEYPKIIFPILIVREKNEYSNFYVGDLVNENYNLLYVKYPISHGIIYDWKEMEK